MYIIYYFYFIILREVTQYIIGTVGTICFYEYDCCLRIKIYTLGKQPVKVSAYYNVNYALNWKSSELKKAWQHWETINFPREEAEELHNSQIYINILTLRACSSFLLFSQEHLPPFSQVSFMVQCVFLNCMRNERTLPNTNAVPKTRSNFLKCI